MTLNVRNQYARWNNIIYLMNKYYYITLDNSLYTTPVIIPNTYITEMLEYDSVSISGKNILVDNLPSHIKNLMLDFEFNEPIDNLPHMLETLYLSDKFNKPIPYLPIRLKHLSIGVDFNQPLDNLPLYLETLDLNCENFNHTLSNLPASLKKFIKGGLFSRHINDLPDTVEYINIHNNTNFMDNETIANDKLKLPKNIKKITIYNYNYNHGNYDVGFLVKKYNCNITIKIE